MFVKFLSSSIVGIDSYRTYELEASCGVQEMNRIVQAIIGIECFPTIQLKYSVENTDTDVEICTSLGAHMAEYCPDISLSEIAIFIMCDLRVEVMGLNGSSNKRCGDECGARMKIFDEVVFEEAMS